MAASPGAHRNSGRQLNAQFSRGLAPLSKPNMNGHTTSPDPRSPQRLALDLQRARQEAAEARGQNVQLLDEVHRLELELERVKGSMRRETNSRLLAEEALDETRERLELAVEAAGLALWDWQKPSKDVFLTAHASEWLGDVAMDGNWDAMSLAKRVHPEDLPKIRQALRQLIEGKTQTQVIQFRVDRGGDWRWVETHGMVAEHDPTGKPLRLMGTHADVHTRKQAEHEIMRARELAEQASQAKSEFLANISHEVRTPLNALMGLTRLLQDSPLNDEQREWLGLMDGSARTLLDLLNDVLDLSRIEAGKMTLEVVEYSLVDRLDQLAGVYEAQAKDKGLMWQCHTTPSLPHSAMGDPTRLQQVISNLLSNAIKFTPKGGSVRFAADVKRAPKDGSAVLRLDVVDTGIGIDAQQQERIFEAFTQADASTARKFGGTGLGLAICARLVRIMGGQIGVESEMGKGSCFWVELPLKLPETTSQNIAAAMQVKATPERKALDGLLVLIAEDHPVNELLMGKMVRRMGAEVLIARNGEEAVNFWQREPIDLIMMDVQMPGTSGLEATRRIRSLELRENRRHTPIVAVTANAMQGDRDMCLAMGMDAYVAKPVEPQALEDAAIEALEKAAGKPKVPPAGDAPVTTRSAQPAAHPAEAGAIDLDKLLRRLDGDKETLRQLAEAMRNDLHERLGALADALTHKDRDLAIAHAHGLKGSLGSMTADRCARLAKGLELAARAEDWSLYERALPLIRAEAKTIDSALGDLLSQPIDAN